MEDIGQNHHVNNLYVIVGANAVIEEWKLECTVCAFMWNSCDSSRNAK